MKPLQALGALALRRRIAAHKAMARAALHANSSSYTRISRYMKHMQCARALEAKGGAQ